MISLLYFCEWLFIGSICRLKFIPVLPLGDQADDTAYPVGLINFKPQLLRDSWHRSFVVRQK